MKKKLLLILMMLLPMVASVVYAQYDSRSYVQMVQSRVNANFNMGVMNIQNMINNSINEAQRTNERIRQANIALLNWTCEYQKENGRQPIDIEKDNWMARNYPDVYPYYIQAKYSNGCKPVSSRKPCLACKQTGNCNCTLDGHSGQTMSYMTNSNGDPIYIRHSYCNGTGKCPACGGSGYIQ